MNQQAPRTLAGVDKFTQRAKQKRRPSSGASASAKRRLEAREEGVAVTLVGREADVSPYLPSNLDGLELVWASEVIDSHEAPVKAVQSKADSSIRVGLELVKKGEAQAFVSAGSTGAVVAGAVLVLGLLPGVERPALGITYATPSGPTMLLDVGANADSRPQFLVQFARLGTRYV
jgi:glycerol-3-phosphate acyltransferase PlsX